MEKDVRLDAILDYEMDENEAFAYKIALMWIDQSRKLFPDYQHTGMKRGDPRKSLIFKICFKLRRETIGILDEKDYTLYIRSQLDILRHLKAGIDPNCLVGDKAWKRWKLWKRKYDAITKKPSDLPQISATSIKAIAGLESSKEFITKTIGKDPDIARYRECYANKNLFRWCNLGKISPYYLAMSPFIAEVMSAEDQKRLNFDLHLYKNCINKDVIQKFKELFPNEMLI